MILQSEALVPAPEIFEGADCLADPQDLASRLAGAQLLTSINSIVKLTAVRRACV